jgi:hypothetical protein
MDCPWKDLIVFAEDLLKCILFRLASIEGDRHLAHTGKAVGPRQRGPGRCVDERERAGAAPHLVGYVPREPAPVRHWLVSVFEGRFCIDSCVTEVELVEAGSRSSEQYINS